MANKLTWQQKASLVCYFIFLLITLLFSYVYLSRSEFMPYHAAAVGLNWDEVTPAFQNLILGLMKAVGAGWLSIGIATFILLVRSIKNEMQWAFWAIPTIGVPPALVNLYIAAKMSMNTQGEAPWEFAALGIMALVVGLIMSMVPKTS